MIRLKKILEQRQADYDLYEALDEVKQQVLSDFASGRYKKQPWQIVKFDKLKYAWEDFMRLGFVQNRNEKIIDYIVGLFQINILKLHVNTELAGHSPHDPSEDFAEYGIKESAPDSNGYFNKKGLEFGDYIVDKYGAWRLSDSVLEQLETLLLDIRETTDYSKKLVALDAILNVVHPRSDLASWFVEGGRHSLNVLYGEKRGHSEYRKYDRFKENIMRENMIRIKDILLENNQPKLELRGLIDKFLKFDGKTLIFLDMKTVGVDPNEAQAQITKMGIIVIDGSTMKDIKKLNLKINLGDYSKRFLDKQLPAHIAYDAESEHQSTNMLNMKGYFKKLPLKQTTEANALVVLQKVFTSMKNPVLVSRDSKNDIRFIKVRAERLGINIPNIPAMDILTVSRIFFIPALEALQSSQLIKSLKKFRLVKMKDLDAQPEKPIVKNKETEFDKYVDPVTGEENLKIYFGHPVSSLGDISPKVLHMLSNPEQALSDVRILIGAFSKIIEFLKEHPDLNTSKDEYNTIRRATLKAKKVKKQNEA